MDGIIIKCKGCGQEFYTERQYMHGLKKYCDRPECKKTRMKIANKKNYQRHRKLRLYKAYKQYNQDRTNYYSIRRHWQKRLLINHILMIEGDWLEV